MTVTINASVNMTGAEVMMLDRFCQGWTTVERRSDREFDLGVSGRKMVESPTGGEAFEVGFSAWLPLAVIGGHPQGWSKEVFAMSDYPTMVGDWSAIRDSEPETIWRIFDYLTEGGSR